MSALASFLKKIGEPARLAALLGHVQQDNISANGTTQNSATLLTGTLCRVSTATVGVNDSIRISKIVEVRCIPTVVRNDSAGAVQLFPSSNEQINSLGVNNSYSISSGTIVHIWPISSARWIVG